MKIMIVKLDLVAVENGLSVLYERIIHGNEDRNGRVTLELSR